MDTTKEISPWLSVIIPTFNAERYLQSTLESVAAQDLENVEILLIDDGSQDRTAEIVENFRSRLPIQIFFREHTGNWVQQTNFGIAHAHGRYLSFLHQDDLWDCDRLLYLRRACNKFPQAVMFFHPSRFIDFRERDIGIWNCPFTEEENPIAGKKVLERLFVQNFISLPGTLFLRQAVLDAGMLDEKLWFTADWKCWLSLVERGEWVYLARSLSSFRLHPSSLTVQGSGHRGTDDFRRQLEIVQEEFWPSVQRVSTRALQIRKLAACSTRINTLLAAMLHHDRARRGRGWTSTFLLFLSLWPLGWIKFFSYTRLHERVWARLRVNLRAKETEC